MKLLLFNLCFGLVIYLPAQSFETHLTKDEKQEIIQIISVARSAGCDQPENIISSENDLAEKYYYLLALKGTAHDTAEIQSLRVVAEKELTRLANLHRYCR